MSKRVYNILFHTHTVSGLVISVALYVIFFAGSISFFRDDIIAWERQEPIVAHTQMKADFDVLMDTISSRYLLHGRTIRLLQPHQEHDMICSIEPSKNPDAPDEAKTSVYVYLDKDTLEEQSYLSAYTLGEFIYRLHFFAQIPYPYGYLLSGFVAFFFLFAIITGTIVHWKKIVSNFYMFRPQTKLKTIWTDAHTALGVLGLPFQFIFAVTGAVLIIGTIVMLAPASSFIYGNDTATMYRELQGDPEMAVYQGDTVEVDHISYNSLIQQATNGMPDSFVSGLTIENYGDQSMRIRVASIPKSQSALLGLGRVVFDVNGQIIAQSQPAEMGYVVGVNQLLRKLHFGNFGGYAIKALYFIFGMITCFVILSGLLIWVEARDKKSTDPWKRKANDWLANIFLALSLSMYPVTAFIFCVVKWMEPVTNTYAFLSRAYFLPWLILTFVFSLRKSKLYTTKYALLLGAILGFCVPVLNGAITGNWFWLTFHAAKIQLFVVDTFWLLTSLLSLLTCFMMVRNQSRQNRIYS